MRDSSYTREHPSQQERNSKQRRDIDNAKSNFDVKAYLDNKKILYSIGGDNVAYGWVGVRCIYCSDHANHLGINLRTKQTHCFKCGAGGDILRFVQDLENISFSATLIRAREFESIKKKEEVKIRESKGKVEFPSTFRYLEKKNLPIVVKEYLKTRRFKKDLISDYKLGYCEGGFYEHYMIVPIILDGKVVSWQAVDATLKGRLRYIDCPKDKGIMFNKQLVYGIDGFKHKQAILVEGLTDKWRVGGEGLGLFGKGTKDQMTLMVERLSRELQIKVMLDPDATREGKRFASELVAVFKRVRFIKLLGDKDPADLSDEEMEEIKSL
jgi:hypothetical protein